MEAVGGGDRGTLVEVGVVLGGWVGLRLAVRLPPLRRSGGLPEEGEGGMVGGLAGIRR